MSPGSSSSYSSGNSSAWVGSGILNNPIGDFFEGTFNNRNIAPFFAANNAGSVRITINSTFILEPREYAFVFGLLGSPSFFSAVIGKGNAKRNRSVRSRCQQKIMIKFLESAVSSRRPARIVSPCRSGSWPESDDWQKRSFSRRFWGVENTVFQHRLKTRGSDCGFCSSKTIGGKI